MKLSKFFAIAVAAVMLTGAASCSSSSSADSATEAGESVTLSVDSLMADPLAFAGDTITVEGLCSHLCKHGGRKAFLTGADGENVIRCEATAAIGGAFSPDCVGKQMSIRGVVCESRIGENEIREMEERYAKTEGNADHACDTEAKAQGQDSIDTFAARMADYRARINERMEKENKDYLSFFYIEAFGYEVAE